jgi:hypothetical protein
MKRVVIHWLDIHTSIGWEDAKDSKLAPAECQSIGFVIADTPGFVTLASTVGCSGPEDVEVNNRICIPRGCIVRIERLGQGRR